MASLGGYELGWAVLVALLVPAGWAAVEVRRWLLGGWSGAWARLAEAVTAASVVLGVAEVLGVAGELNRPGVAVGGIVGGCGIGLGARRLPRHRGRAQPRPEPVDGWALAGAGVAVVAVTAQWLAWTAQALRQGMTAYDSVFYHGPMAARFAQSGSLTRIQSVVPGEAVAFFPATAEVWHALGIVAFRTDVLSPLLNLGALGIGLLAAWCLGRHLGGLPAAVAGVALIAAMPYVVASQPGSSFNDVVALAALLAAVALCVRAVDDRAAGLIGALAAGLAVGIKLSFAVPAVLVAATCCLLLPRGRRFAALCGRAAVVVGAGGFWYVRNLVQIGNPMPGINTGLPSPTMPVVDKYGTRLLSSLDLSGHGWRTLYRVGLQDYFGRGWPGMTALVVIGTATGVWAWRRWRVHGAIGVAAGLALVIYTVTPATGDPAFFRFNLRYTLPVQGLVVMLLATHPRLQHPWAQRLMVALALLGILVAWPGPAPGSDPFQIGGWPTGAGHRLAAAALAVALLGVGAGLWAVWQVAPRALAVGVLVAVGAGALVAGRGVEDRYLRGRYRDLPGELGPAWTWAQGVTHARIAVAGLYQQYPFYGPRLDNVVNYVGLPTAHDGLARAPSCRVWRNQLVAGRYQYVVTSREGIFPPPGEPPEAGWTRSDPAVHEILHTGDTAVFAIRGALDPAAC